MYLSYTNCQKLQQKKRALLSQETKTRFKIQNLSYIYCIIMENLANSDRISNFG